jgi:hypothetical protein
VQRWIAAGPANSPILLSGNATLYSGTFTEDESGGDESGGADGAMMIRRYRSRYAASVLAPLVRALRYVTAAFPML